METFGIAALEGMAVGKPTIFSVTGPGPEVVEDGVSGLLCDPYSAKDIADKILKILCDSNLAESLSQGALARVSAMFDKRDWVQRNVSFYETCIASMKQNASCCNHCCK